MTQYLHVEEPSSVSSFPSVVLEPTLPMKMKRAISGLGDELTVLQVGQHLLKYEEAWYNLVKSTICWDDWRKPEYRLASGLVVTIESPDLREDRENKVSLELHGTRDRD